MKTKHHPRGTLYVISAPSGAGKTTLVNALVAKEKNIQISVSVTTRPKRPAETAGRSYRFATNSQFNALVEQNTFLEHAVVFGYQYGTSKKWVEKTLAAGKDVILEIDWQGAKQVQLKIQNCVSIFILPPSIAALRKRLKERGQDSPAVIKRRLQVARREIAHYQHYDYLVVNAVFEDALASLRAIVQARRLTLSARKNILSRLLKNLVSTEHSI